jgi:hypothetical protein
MELKLMIELHTLRTAIQELITKAINEHKAGEAMELTTSIETLLIRAANHPDPVAAMNLAQAALTLSQVASSELERKHRHGL